MTHKLRIFLFFLLCIPLVLPAQPDQQDASNGTQEKQTAKIYRNPEERREAGLGTPLTGWLTFSGLVEMEQELTQFTLDNRQHFTEAEQLTTTLQLGLEIQATDWLGAELVFELEKDNNIHSKLDEGIIFAEGEDRGVKFGVLNLPFGEYYSHLVIDAALQFGETRETALVVDYSPSDGIELGAFIFDSEIGRASNEERYDWGAYVELKSEDESLQLGASYISDLSETDDPLLEDNPGFYSKRVDGLSAYALLGMDHFEITAELVRALDTFAELKSDRDQPIAYNLELAYFPRPKFQFAARVAYSDELDEQAQWQYGIGATWVIGNHITASIAYLYNQYKSGFVQDEDDNDLDYSQGVAVQFALEF